MSAPKGKVKFLLWAFPDSLELVRNTYKKANCRSQSEFIEKAIQYYAGRVNAEDDVSYLPNAFLSNMKGIVTENTTRQNRILFKLAVEMAMMMNILAANCDVTEESLSTLRQSCIDEVKRINGTLGFEDAYHWQKD